ncbi:MAG: dihydroorotate dehydrogenase [Chitinivibrionales bacterium]|nr:dihydroorotate dehydrogenase [Chitinivibrionales bacterium]
MDLSVAVGAAQLPNPVGVASGTFGYGSEYEKLVNLQKVGALFTKAVTLEPRPGNDIPRIIETPSGLINSIGLANVGVDRFVKEKIPFLSQLPCAIIPNVAGSSEADYLKVVATLEHIDDIWGYEINLSCPNVQCGGMAIGTDPAQVEHLTAKLRAITPKPVIVKLTPNVTDIAVIAKAAERGGADAVSCINTLVGMVIDIHKKRPVIASGTGGLSGPAIRPVGVAMTYRTSQAIDIPVIGIGGIMTAEDAIQYFLAGASAIQVGTGTFVDPGCIESILAGIIDYCEKENLHSISDFGKIAIT